MAFKKKNRAARDDNGVTGLMGHASEDTLEQIKSKEGLIASLSQNIVKKFREAFEVYNPVTDIADAIESTRWIESKGSWDIIQLDGNAVGASYLSISKDPLSQGTLSAIETVDTFEMPIDEAVGLCMSQRVVGQEFFVDFIDTDADIVPLSNINILSVQQTGTTITITTDTPSNLPVGKRIGLKNIPDARLNYPALVIGAIVSPVQFQCTAGPNGTIPSVSSALYNTGTIFFRSVLNNANNGVTQVFESTTTTQSSFYTRSESGDVFPSGTKNGAHVLTTGTTTPAVLVSSPLTYAFAPSTIYKLNLQADRVQWHYSGADGSSGSSTSFAPDTVVPNPAKQYKFRIRARNNESLTIPVAQIVSITKLNNTTSRVVMDRAVPEITVLTPINLYGARDQTASYFPNITTATNPTNIVNTTTFDIPHGTLGSGAVTYGGYVSIVNGGITQQGAIAPVIQSASIAQDANGINVLSLVGSVTWVGTLAVGDYVNSVGLRNIVNGTTMGLDGVFRVRNIVTTVIDLEPIGGTIIPSSLISTNCGGALIKRTDMRISFVRIFQYERERVETVQRPNSDVSWSNGVVVNNTVNTTNTTATAVDSVMPNPFPIGGRATNINIAAMSAAGDLVGWAMSMIGVGIIKPYSISESDFSTTPVTVTNTTSTAFRAAAAAGIKNYITSIELQNTNAVATSVNILAGVTIKKTYSLPANMTVPITISYPTPLSSAAAEAFNIQCATTGANVIINAQGYIAP